MTTIKVSIPTFHEIASALEKQGKKLAVNTGIITIEKDDTIINPIDWRLATVRKDCIIEAVKTGDKNVLKLAKEMFNYVIEGKIENETKTEKAKETGWSTRS